MIEPAILAKHLRYGAWATFRLLDFSLTIPEPDLTRDLHNSHGGILKTFQHIYYADRVWLSRMEANPVPAFEDPTPGPSLATLKATWPDLLHRFQLWASTQDPNRVMHFHNVKGEAYSKTVFHIVSHVVNHGTYHRGQIAAMLRQTGHVPPSTDLIYYNE